ncbi:MAG: thioesterase family protein [Bacteroidia bacterium]|nr:thioesterase family protein [Bacteroidia bacterium]
MHTPPPFRVTLQPRWADLDPNNHVRHSAYADYGAQARLVWFAAHGFTAARFLELRMGPILFREELVYQREIRLGETVHLSVEKLYLSDDGRKWGIFHQFTKDDGTPVAQITCDGAWIDLEKRKLAVPPDDLRQALEALPIRPGQPA